MQIVVGSDFCDTNAVVLNELVNIDELGIIHE